MYNRKKRELIFESPWMQLFLDDVIDHNDNPLKYNVVHTTGDSVVAVVKKDHFYLMAEVYRYPIGQVQHEFPAGGIESGETPQEAAIREVWEETGVKISCQETVYSFYPSNGILDQKMHVVFADYVNGEPEVREEILNCYWLKEEELMEAVLAGEITDAPTLVALFYDRLRHRL